jgi:diaminopimelate decarboxylase
VRRLSNLQSKLKEMGSGLDTASIQKVQLGLAGYDPENILYT